MQARLHSPVAEARSLTTSTAEVFSMVLRPDDPLSFDEEGEEEEEPIGTPLQGYLAYKEPPPP